MLNQMKKQVLLVLGASLLVAGAAQAEMVAGWDFSQYGGEATMTTSGDFSTYVNALGANYSDLDPTQGAGAESATYGTAHFNGTNGSTNVAETGFVNGELTPISGSLTTNNDAPNPLTFDSFAALQAEGQVNANALRMTWVGATDVDIVFQATLGSAGTFDNFEMTFAGITFAGTADVTVEFASMAPGGNPTFSLLDTVTLTTTDTAFTTAALSSIASDTVWFRLGISGGGNQVAFDNVSINATLVPEPATAMLMMTGLMGLGLAGRRRR